MCEWWGAAGVEEVTSLPEGGSRGEFVLEEVAVEVREKFFDAAVGVGVLFAKEEEAVRFPSDFVVPADIFLPVAVDFFDGFCCSCAVAKA